MQNDRWFSLNPLGTIINLGIIYSQFWSDVYSKNKFIAFTLIATNILTVVALPPALAIIYWKTFIA